MGTSKGSGDAYIEQRRNDLVLRLNSASTREEIVVAVDEADRWLYLHPDDRDVSGARASAALRITGE